MEYRFIIFIFIFFSSLSGYPTQSFLKRNHLEKIKYFLRADKVTFEDKEIFCNAIGNEGVDFVGYMVFPREFRVYQDIIKLLLEEIVEIKIPRNFVFLAVPGYDKRQTLTLQDVADTFFYKPQQIPNIRKQLVHLHPVLYANYKSIGFCPILEFSLNRLEGDKSDLTWLCEELGIDNTFLKRAFELGYRLYSNQSGLLIQLFDPTFSDIDEWAYPAWPSGHPAENHAITDYLYGEEKELPRQFFLLLDDQGILNPTKEFKFRRWDRVKSNAIVEYEKQLREMVKSLPFDSGKSTLYKKKLGKMWGVNGS